MLSGRGAVTAPIWLASYPKSGNTWLRLLLANVGRDTPVSINTLAEGGAWAAMFRWFDAGFLISSALLRPDEADQLRPLLYRYAAAQPDKGRQPAARYIKTHDAYVRLGDGTPLMGGREAARGAVLVVRDPRDVVTSFANHLSLTADEVIEMMGDPHAALCAPAQAMDNQLRQPLLTWSGFAESWLDQTDIPVHLVRYEDMHAETAAVLAGVLAFAGQNATKAQIERAVAFSQFRLAQEDEQRHGFREAPKMTKTDISGSGRFFRRGEAGIWREELTAAQAARIEHDHGAVMRRLGYLT